jgi:hypothetical protein
VTKSTGEDWVGAPARARELGIMLRTLYKIIDSGELPSYKLGRVIRYPVVLSNHPPRS